MIGVSSHLEQPRTSTEQFSYLFKRSIATHSRPVPQSKGLHLPCIGTGRIPSFPSSQGFWKPHSPGLIRPPHRRSHLPLGRIRPGILAHLPRPQAQDYKTLGEWEEHDLSRRQLNLGQVILPFIVATNFLFSAFYSLSPLLAFFQQSETTPFRLIRIRESYVRKLLIMRALWIEAVCLLITAILTVIFTLVPGHRL